MDGSATFNEKCYALLKQIPKGRVSTYKEIAEALGTKAYRAVGNAMNKNPYPTDKYPCHRVVKSDGSIGGYASGTDKKVERLLSEGYHISGGKVKNFNEILMKSSDFKID